MTTVPSRRTTRLTWQTYGTGYRPLPRSSGTDGIIRPPRPPRPRPRPTGNSKSGLLPSSTSCSGTRRAGGGCQRGFTGRSDMEVKWLVSLAAGERRPSAIFSSGMFGGGISPAGPGTRAGGTAWLPRGCSTQLAGALALQTSDRHPHNNHFPTWGVSGAANDSSGAPQSATAGLRDVPCHPRQHEGAHMAW